MTLQTIIFLSLFTSVCSGVVCALLLGLQLKINREHAVHEQRPQNTLEHFRAHAQQLADQMSSLTEVTEKTLAIVHTAGTQAEHEHIRRLADEMLSTVRRLRVNTETMQQHLAEIIKSLEQSR